MFFCHFILANNADPNEMPRSAESHKGSLLFVIVSVKLTGGRGMTGAVCNVGIEECKVQYVMLKLENEGYSLLNEGYIM